MNNPVELSSSNQLQTKWAPPRRPDPSAPPEDRLDLRAIYFALQRQRYVIMVTVALFVILAVILTVMQTPLYTASTSVVLNTGEDRVIPKKDAAAAVPPDSDVVDTEVEVIRSRELARSVAQALKLDRNPRFNPPVVSGGQPRTPELQRSAMVAKVLDGLVVQRIGTTFAFNISMTAANPRDAQAIANEYASQYTLLYLNRRRADGSSAASLLSSRLEDLRNQAQIDTERVQQYRIANNLLSTSGASLSEQEISSYNQEVATARAEAAADQARLATARAQLRAGSMGDDVGEALNSSVVSELRGKRSEVSGRLAALQAQFGPLYPAVVKAKSELEDVDGQISAEIKRIISNLEAKVEVSSGRLGSIAGSLGSARGQLTANNRAMVGLDDLTRRAEASQQLYDSYLAQYKQTVASQGTERPEARVISSAELPTTPVSPRPILNVLLALVIGAGIGVVIALIREALSSGLATATDVESRLSVRCLGSIPLLRSIQDTDDSPATAIVEAPQSGFAEAFRGVRTSIHYAVGDPRQVLMITSALPREGKTTISTCLARMIALSGETVVLVDVDPRQRGTSRLMGAVDGGPGLLEVLRGETSLDEALVHDPSSGAWILPIRGAIGSLGDLMIGEQMSELIEDLRRRFGVVLLDAAPVLPIADTRALAAKADAVIMVARWRSTADHAVRAALRLLPYEIVPIAGVVLSQVDIRKQAKFGYGDSAFYYAKYKDYYG